MDYKQVLISAQLHRRIKIATALRGQTIRAFAEEALIKHLESFSLPNSVERTTESLEATTETPPDGDQ